MSYDDDPLRLPLVELPLLSLIHANKEPQYEDGMHTGVAEKEGRQLKGTTTHVGLYEK